MILTKKKKINQHLWRTENFWRHISLVKIAIQKCLPENIWISSGLFPRERRASNMLLDRRPKCWEKSCFNFVFPNMVKHIFMRKMIFLHFFQVTELCTSISWNLWDMEKHLNCVHYFKNIILHFSRLGSHIRIWRTKQEKVWIFLQHVLTRTIHFSESNKRKHQYSLIKINYCLQQ